MLRLPFVLTGLAVLISGCEHPTAPLLPSAAVAAVVADEKAPESSSPVKKAEKAEKKQVKGKSVKDKSDDAPAQYNKLSEFESWVILQKGTERAFTGEYTDLKDPGTYICRRCNAPLYKAKDKFASHCGWPSFDDEIEGAVRQSRDADGYRVEITCKNCSGHLGHVFFGEGFTEKNTRHCVNSVSMKFIPENAELPPVIRKKSSRSSRSSKADESDPKTVPAEPNQKQSEASSAVQPKPSE